MTQIKRDWPSLIQQHADSGLSIAKFCRPLGLCPKNFSKRKQAAAGPKPHKGKPFIKLRSDNGGHTKINTPPISPATPGIKITFGDCKIDLPLSTDPQWLARLLQSLS